jgi:hypothetical protein
LKVQKKDFYPAVRSPISIAGFFVEGSGSRAANLLPQADRSSLDFESRAETRPGEKFILKDP